MIKLWNSAKDHTRQGTTARYKNIKDPITDKNWTNGKLVAEARLRGAKVITVGNLGDALWSPKRCKLPLGKNSSTQLVETAAKPQIFEYLGGDRPRPITLKQKKACLERSHGWVLSHKKVLQRITKEIKCCFPPTEPP